MRFINFTCIAGILSMSIVPAYANDFTDIFFDDAALRARMAKKSGNDIETITKKDINDYRFGICGRLIQENQFPSSRMRKYCNKVWRMPDVEYRVVETNDTADSKKIESSSHDQCLDARDYEGCIKVKSGVVKIQKPKCDDKGRCLANGEIDKNGNLLPKGWWCDQPNTSIYECFDRNSISRVPHKGQQSRYLAVKSVQYKYNNARAGTAGSTSQIGSSQTNCTGYGAMINCTTTPPITITTPGSAGTPGGWSRFLTHQVYDCKDKTAALYFRGKPKGNWVKLSTERTGELCKRAESLPVKNMKL